VIAVPQLVGLGCAVLAVACLDALLKRTRIGRGLRTIAEDAETAVLLGVPVERVVPVVFIVGGLFTALSGFLFAVNYQQASPFMGEEVALKGIAAGGRRHGQHLGRPRRPPRPGQAISLPVRRPLSRHRRLRAVSCFPFFAPHRDSRRRHPPAEDLMSGYLESVLVLLAINTILAYGAFLPMVAGQLNLGVAAFVAIGAYGGGYLSQTYGVHPALAALVAVAVSGAIGWIVAFPILRTRGIYLALATFALNQVVQGTILNMNVVGGASGYPVPAHIGFPVVAAFAIVVVLVVAALFHTRFGISVTAVSDDERVADLMGLSVRGLQSAAFTAGAALAGLGGALYAHHFNYIEVQNYGVMFSIYVVMFVLLGGTQTVYGPLLGAAVFTLLPELLRGSASWRYVIFACLIIGIMSLRPQGVVSRWFWK
jgi:branched-chain amino acid transport system permease protein